MPQVESGRVAGRLDGESCSLRRRGARGIGHRHRKNPETSAEPRQLAELSRKKERTLPCYAGKEQGKLSPRADLEATREACARWREADEVKAAILANPAAAEVRAQMRATLREALGAQIEMPGGRRALRRL